MKVMKRNGAEVEYDGSKIMSAARKASESIADESQRLTPAEITVIEERIRHRLESSQNVPDVESIQNMVIKEIYAMGRDKVGLCYAEYRYKHEQLRKMDKLYENCITLLDDRNEEAKGENANKLTTLLSTQRDYIAGFVNKVLNKLYYINDEVITQYHESGQGHHHDQDYTAQRMTNCGLINLDDCLQNGTVISGKTISKPKSFRSATNVGSQVIGMVASFQFGGQTFNLAHFLPFVETSRRKIRARIVRQQERLSGIVPFNTPDIPIDDEMEQQSQHPFLDDINAKISIAHAQGTVDWDIPEEEFWKQHQQLLKTIDKNELDALIENELQTEIADGVQTIQYQLVTYMTTNGQSPFVSMYINLDDAKTEQEKLDYCKVIREVFLQRIIGIPDARGVFVPTAFPKILYVIDEGNKPGDSFAELDGKLKSKYWEITYMAAICSAKVMTPDYISAKKMREYKQGDVYPCMGCVDGESVIDYKFNGIRRAESFRRAWNRLSNVFEVKRQPNGKDFYMDTDGVEIYDNQKGCYVKQHRMIRNTQSDWYKVTFSNESVIDATNNHPFEINGKGVVLAENIVIGDETLYQSNNANNNICKVTGITAYHEEKYSYDVTTESEHFMVNGILSHNCRSFLTIDRFTEKYGNMANALNYKPGEHKYFGRFNMGRQICPLSA